MIPRPQDRYRPRADADHLPRWIREAWAAHAEALVPEAERRAVADDLARHLESLYPAADMDVLARYGCAVERDEVVVRVHDGGVRWPRLFNVRLPRGVRGPAPWPDVYCGGPRFSRDPTRGLTEYGRTRLSEEEFAKHCARLDRAERAMVPEHLEPYFARLLQLRQDGERMRAAVQDDFPTAFKERHGQYPTWGEIEAEFPILGQHMDRLRTLERLADRLEATTEGDSAFRTRSV